MAKYYIKHNIKIGKKFIKSGTENEELNDKEAEYLLSKGSIVDQKDYEASKNAVVLSKDEMAKELTKLMKENEKLKKQIKDLEKGNK